MPVFYQRLNYSFGNEDWTSEQKALRVTPQDTVLSITASGDRPLNLLASACRSLIAVDANPIQNYLLELKRAALAGLEFDDYLALMGVEECPKRSVLFRHIAKDLAPAARAHWSCRSHLIDKGVIYQGFIERMLRWTSRCMRAFRGQKIDRLLSFDNLEEQRTFVRRIWETPLWRACFDVALHPLCTRLFVRDPGLYLAVDPAIRPGAYLHGKLHAFLQRTLAKESLLLSLLLTGKATKEALPPYVTASGAEAIVPQLDSLSIHTADVVRFLEDAEENSIDCFSLSDVASYLKRPDFERLLRAICRTARPGARFCMRQFLSCHCIPPALSCRFVRDPELELQLQQEDRCFVYRFSAGTIV
jgi:S-adenosylmethionine-diacylglycerol 3-amino-3-carboxypropyl transferase